MKYFRLDEEVSLTNSVGVCSKFRSFSGFLCRFRSIFSKSLNANVVENEVKSRLEGALGIS